MSRKSKYTPERVKKIADAIRIGKTYKAAYTAAGIAKDTFFEWLNK